MSIVHDLWRTSSGLVKYSSWSMELSCVSVICVEHRIASYWAEKNCHGNSIKVGRCKQPLQWTFFCHDSRTQRTWIGIACVLGWNRMRVRWGVSEEVEVNRKTFAHASHPSFLPSFLPAFLPSRTWQYSNPYLGDRNAQLIPCQCGHQPIRIVSASQSDRTSLQKIAPVNSVGARTTWTHADLQSTLGTLELGLAGADACALRWGRRSWVKPSTVVAKQ